MFRRIAKHKILKNVKQIWRANGRLVHLTPGNIVGWLLGNLEHQFHFLRTLVHQEGQQRPGLQHGQVATAGPESKRGCQWISSFMHMNLCIYDVMQSDGNSFRLGQLFQGISGPRHHFETNKLQQICSGFYCDIFNSF